MCALAIENRLNSFDYAANKFRELVKRWDNRLTLEGKSLAEEYKNLSFSVVCDLAISDFGQSLNGASTTRNNPMPQPNRAFAVFNANARDKTDIPHWNQEPVLVKNVEFVQGPNGRIPSTVRVYLGGDKVRYSDRGSLYLSAIDGSYKFIAGFSKRESSEIVVFSQSPKHYLVNREIERSFEVVNGIADDEAKTWRNHLSNFGFDLFISSNRVTVNTQDVDPSSSKNLDVGIQVCDVLLGPFNL
jgi:hypothetical protein